MFENRSTRRRFLGQAGVAGLAVAAGPAWADKTVMLPLPGGPQERPITTEFPQKGTMILQRARPPLLETPFEVFDQSVFTPNDQFFVRWHWSMIPTEIDAAAFRLTVRGNVNQTLSLSLKDLQTGFPSVEFAAVNQCAGNSRGMFQPRVPGAQWANGAMGNALWRGVRLKDVLDRAGVKPGSVQVRFKGLDEPIISDSPHFIKSLDVDNARDGEVMIAYSMNGAPLPLLNGFPLRLIAPGWYSTYWLKMLSDIEVLTAPDDNFWMKSSYLIPDNPHADVKPGETGFKTVPIGRMVPRSFITNMKSGATIPMGKPALARGIALGGDVGVAKVDFSSDGGKSWFPAKLGKDYGKYSFRQWEAQFAPPAPGDATLMVRCTNSTGVVQPDTANWNGSGYMRNVIESTPVTVA